MEDSSNILQNEDLPLPGMDLSDVGQNYIPVLIKEEGMSEPLEILLPRYMLEQTNGSVQQALAELGLELSHAVEYPPKDQELEEKSEQKDISVSSQLQMPDVGSSKPALDINNSNVPKVCDDTSYESQHNRQMASERAVPETSIPKKTQTQNIRIKKGQTDSVTIDLTVSMKDFKKYIPHIGFNFNFSCKKCKFTAKTYQGLAAHLEKKCLSKKHRTCQSSADSSKPGNRDGDGEGDDSKEHNYANKTETELPLPMSRELLPVKAEPVDYTDELLSDNTVPKQQKAFFCHLCPYTLLHSHTELEVHRSCHLSHNDTSMTCFLCKDEAKASVKNTRNWSLLKIHLTKKHELDFELPCHICEEVFKSHEQLKAHEYTHSQTCPMCTFCTTSDKDFQVHTACHQPANHKKYFCCICGYRSKQGETSWHRVNTHILSQHPEVYSDPYKCELCKRGFQGVRLFADHIRACIGQPKSEKIAAYQCMVCERNIEGPKYLDHLKACTGTNWNSLVQKMLTEGVISIETKPEAFNDGMQDTPFSSMLMEPDLNEAVRSEQLQIPDKDLQCLVHKVQFPDQDLLMSHFVQEHLRNPTELINFNNVFDSVTVEAQVDEESLVSDAFGQEKCLLCYKKFATQKRLEKHISKVHSGDKLNPVKCQFCGKLFKTGVRRRNHIREVHENKKRRKIEKPQQPKKCFVCEECGYVTPSRDRLRNHQLAVHAGVLPFKCKLCDFKTSERGDLVRHKYKHTGVKKHSCQYCSYKTNERWVLVNHCLRQHRVQLPKITRNTVGLPGSLRWQQAQERQKNIERVRLEKLQNEENAKKLAETTLQEYITDGQVNLDLQVFQDSVEVVGQVEDHLETNVVGSNQGLTEIIVPMPGVDSEQGVLYIQAADLQDVSETEQASLMLLTGVPSVHLAEEEEVAVTSA